MPLLRLLSRPAAARPLTRSVSTIHSTITKPNVPGTPNTSATNETPNQGSPATGISPRHEIQESVQEGEEARHRQAPNRLTTWSRSQRPRELGMVGPRFEQTQLSDQPAPWAAIELIHQQPVRWSEDRIVACDGGGGPLGHPKVFINVDKPQVEPCTYCGLPYALKKNRKAIEENQTNVGYPLD